MRINRWFLVFLLLSCSRLITAQAQRAKQAVAPTVLIIIAADKGDIAQVQRLLRQGVSANSESNDATPLLQAAKKGHLKVVRLLLAHGANVNFHDVTGYSAIIASAGRGDIQMTRLLLARGANVNDDWRFGSPLSCAVGRGRLPLVKLLVQAGADVNGGGAYTSVLQDAAAKAYVAVTGYLLRHGAKINNSMRWNRTPLLEATNTHNTAVVALLLRHGADTKERCEAVGMGFETGETALHLAKRKKYFDIVRLLRKASAK